MRPTKFRAWDKENHRMLGPWGLGDVFQRIDTGILPIGKDDRSPWDDTVYTEELIWLEFTGLHDKNGIEIYEGHILDIGRRALPTIAQVVWTDNMASFLAVSKDSFLNLSNTAVMCDGRAEVIGNIYENPGLLENNHAKD